MIPFLILVLILAIGLPAAVSLAFSREWLQEVPSFLYETTWLVAIFTTVIFVYLYRSARPSFFTQLYLLSMAVKLIAYFVFVLVMIMEDRQGAIANVLYFLIVYMLFTAVEIGFLYRKISRRERG